ncbi:MAG: hypothetical protein COV74_01605 [Candidatus Omnitrophica bacterium CG11_big_fil_rev_8_21_14_0_20_45_26]|uniref:SHS2 domain-containing protein n=1 Tax=Candidatus Abzuiibacterium crystallinum TaxID=1974748 RepID=A0A2H0LS35_9BACT|nr:MAG: hypothetical protein COV74_01605 [Candidatus Omnitrophica bacterium CG11_big_fil_rev_8_21_14_0_20_45_26]PIW64992.1 MAG: hypothetical protein COW12_03885 [Candidatus Omnitrophica bacterium CG12_big_fil_rev_8_21_14_0_65_45_16]
MQIPFIQALSSKLSRKEQGGLSQNQVTIGLDIGRAHINAIQLQKASGSIIIDKYAHQQIIPNAPPSQQIAQLFTSAQMLQKNIRISMKGQGVILRFISFPKMTREEFESAIQYEAEKYLPFAMSEVVLDFHICESPQGQTPQKNMDVILVAARRQEVLKLVKTFQEINLQVEAIDVDAIAFSNAFLHVHKEAKEKVFVLIDFGAKDVNVNIINHGILCFSRDITFGGYDITQFLKRKLQIGDQEALAIQSTPNLSQSPHVDVLKQSFSTLIQEIKISINYFYNQHADLEKPSAIYVNGGLARMELLIETIEKEVGIPVKHWNSVEPFVVGPEVKKDELEKHHSYLPVCIGLALR